MTPPFLFVLITLPPAVSISDAIAYMNYSADGSELSLLPQRGFAHRYFPATLSPILLPRVRDNGLRPSGTDGRFTFWRRNDLCIIVRDCDGTSCGTIPQPLPDADSVTVNFSRNGRAVLSFGRNHNSPYDGPAAIVIWDCETSSAAGIIRIPMPPGGMVDAYTALNATGTHLATAVFTGFGGRGVELGVWEVATGERLAARRLTGLSAHSEPFFLTTARVTLYNEEMKCWNEWDWARDAFVPKAGFETDYSPNGIAVEPKGRWFLSGKSNRFKSSTAVIEASTHAVRFEIPSDVDPGAGPFNLSELSYATAVHPNGRQFLKRQRHTLISVPAYPRTRPFTADGAWAGLAADAPTAAAVIGFCLENERSTLDLLDARLKPAVAAPLTAAELRQLIADLDAPQFAIRDAAVKKLKEYPRAAEPMARDTLKTTKSAEQRAKLEAVVAAAGKLSPTDLRGVRCVEILERLDHPAAKPFLAKLAAGDPASPLTKAAKGD